MANEIEKEAELVNKKGDQLFKQKKYREAIDLYLQSVKLMHEAGNMKKAGKFEEELEKAIAKRAAEINDEGDRLFKGKQYEKSMKVYQSAWDLLQKAGEKWQKKYRKEFIKELNKAKIKHAKDDLQVAAEQLVKDKRWDEAIQKYSEILQLISVEVDEKLNKDLIHDMKTVYERWAQEVNNKGDQFYKAGKFEDAIQAYSESVRLIKKSDNEKKKKNFLKELAKAFSEHAQEINNLGDRLMKEKEYLKASEVYRSSVEIAEDSGNKKLVENFTKEMNKAFEKYAQEINNQGDQLYKDKKYEEAAKVYQESVNAAKESNRTKLISNFTKELTKACEKWADQVNSEGDLERKAKNWDAAVEKYDLAFKIIQKTTNESKIKAYGQERLKAYLELAKEINKVGDRLYKEKKYDEAYDVYDKSVKLAEVAGNAKLVRNFQKERNKALNKAN